MSPLNCELPFLFDELNQSGNLIKDSQAQFHWLLGLQEFEMISLNRYLEENLGESSEEFDLYEADKGLW